MSAARHTQGPWELRPDAMGGLSALIFPRDSEYPVASVTGYFNRDGQTLPNARLIASAPEMLQALQFIESVYRKNVVKDGEPSSALAELQRVIAKATGSAA